MCLFARVDDEPSKTTGRVAMALATGRVILRHRPYRRNLLFVLTLVTLAMVFLGAAPLAPALGERPLGFFFFWAVCFLLAGFVLLLAIYDLVRIRGEHRRRLEELERELAEATEEARRLAREHGANGATAAADEGESEDAAAARRAERSDSDEAAGRD